MATHPWYKDNLKQETAFLQMLISNLIKERNQQQESHQQVHHRIQMIDSTLKDQVLQEQTIINLISKMYHQLLLIEAANQVWWLTKLRSLIWTLPINFNKSYIISNNNNNNKPSLWKIVSMELRLLKFWIRSKCNNIK